MKNKQPTRSVTLMGNLEARDFCRTESRNKQMAMRGDIILTVLCTTAG